MTKDLAKRRILHDEECLLRSYELVKEWGTPFKENASLIHLCSGMECNAEIQFDMVYAEQKGKEALAEMGGICRESHRVQYS